MTLNKCLCWYNTAVSWIHLLFFSSINIEIILFFRCVVKIIIKNPIPFNHFQFQSHLCYVNSKTCCYRYLNVKHWLVLHLKEMPCVPCVLRCAEVMCQQNRERWFWFNFHNSNVNCIGSECFPWCFYMICSTLWFRTVQLQGNVLIIYQCTAELVSLSLYQKNQHSHFIC